MRAEAGGDLPGSLSVDLLSAKPGQTTDARDFQKPRQAEKR